MALIDFFLLKLFYLEERSQEHNVSVYFDYRNIKTIPGTTIVLKNCSVNKRGSNSTTGCLLLCAVVELSVVPIFDKRDIKHFLY